MPAFAQLGAVLRQWPQLRLFLAVMASAFVGNLYYHLLQGYALLVQGDLFQALYNLRSRAFYCLLLALGVYVSMLRERRRSSQPPAAGGSRRFLRIAGVWTFFSLIFISVSYTHLDVYKRQGCTPCSWPISLIVFTPRKASRPTFALNSGVCTFRVFTSLIASRSL